MTKMLLPFQLDSYVRDRVDTVLVSGGGNSSKTLHIPRDDCREPLCKARLRNVNKWLHKSLTVYPPNFHPMCSHCAEQRFDMEVLDL